MKSFIFFVVCAIGLGANLVQAEFLRFSSIDVTIIDDNMRPELAVLAKYTLAELYRKYDSNEERSSKLARVFEFRAEYDADVTDCEWHVIVSDTEFFLEPKSDETYIRLETTATLEENRATNLSYFHLFSSHKAGQTCKTIVE